MVKKSLTAKHLVFLGICVAVVLATYATISVIDTDGRTKVTLEQVVAEVEKVEEVEEVEEVEKVAHENEDDGIIRVLILAYARWEISQSTRQNFLALFVQKVAFNLNILN